MRYTRVMAALQPIKAALIADLVDLINENLGALLRVTVVACPDCGGTGLVGVNPLASEPEANAGTCPTCKGVGAIERYGLDDEQLRTERYGRLIEGFDLKHGQFVPRFRSKDKAFAMLVKLLGLEKAVIEVANAAPFAEALSDDQRSAYVEQLKELAQMGLLDRT